MTGCSDGIFSRSPTHQGGGKTPCARSRQLWPTWLPAMSTGLEMPKPMRSFSLAEANLPSRSSSTEMPRSSAALRVSTSRCETESGQHHVKDCLKSSPPST